MKSVFIRNLPEAVVAALKKRGAENKSSLQKELRHLLITFAQQQKQQSAEEFELVLTEGLTTQVTWSRDELYDDAAR
jgi:plasmid stability protein